MAFAFMSAAPGLAKDAPIELAPSSSCSMDAEVDRCAAARQFGEGRDETVLMLKLYDPLAALELTLLGRPLTPRYQMTRDQRDFKYRVAFLPDGPVKEFGGDPITLGEWEGILAIERSGSANTAGANADANQLRKDDGPWHAMLGNADALHLSGDFNDRSCFAPGR